MRGSCGSPVLDTWALINGLIALIAFSAGLSNASGVGVHLSLLHRTQSYLPKDVSDASQHSRPGAFFPDAFYTCMGHSDAAEDAHWPPFLKIAVDYWHEKYGPGSMVQGDLVHGGKGGWFGWIAGRIRGQQARLKASESVALRAFIYGMMSHQVADVSWHSLGVNQGLLTAMSKREFNGDTSAAHSVLDTGGDMIFVREILQSEMNTDWLDGVWEYPRGDIVEIFRRAGYNIHTSELDYCMIRGRVAIKSELQVSQTAYVPYAEKSPLLYNSVKDYYLGGLAELTMSIRHCSYRLAEWFENGTPDDPWELCSIFDGMKGKRSVGLVESSNINEYVMADNKTNQIHYGASNILTTGMDQGHFGTSLAFGSFINGETCVAISSPYESDRFKNSHTGKHEYIPTGSVYIMPLSELQSVSPNQQTTLEQNNNISGTDAYTYNGRFGMTLATISIFGLDVLVASEPGLSKISLFVGARRIADIKWYESTVKYGAKGTKLVGESLAVGDLDNDGKPDLIIGAPYADVGGISQQGQVYVIRGKTLEHIFLAGLNNGKENGPIEIGSNQVVSDQITTPPGYQPFYALFGSKLLVSNGTLLVGSEGLFCVFAYSLQENKLVLRSTIQDPDMPSSSRFSNFGGALLSGAGDVIVIGSSAASGSDQTELLQAGVVHAYKMESSDFKHIAKIVAHDAKSFEHFGYTGRLVEKNGEYQLYVSSPHANEEGGAIWKIELGQSEPEFIEAQQLIQGPKPLGVGFGSAISISKDNWLAVGIPNYGLSDNTPQGGVGMYRL